jgi:alpha-glucosidase
MDIILRNTTLQYRAIGGILDFYFYTGPTPQDVVRQYVSSIGLPTMQQYWTLGFHQCRWGYHNTSDLQNVVDSYREFNIPLETIWTDIDCLPLLSQNTNVRYVSIPRLDFGPRFLCAQFY